MTDDGLAKANGWSSSDIGKRRGVLLAAAGMHGVVVCQLRGALAMWQLLADWASAASAAVDDFVCCATRV